MTRKPKQAVITITELEALQAVITELEALQAALLERWKSEPDGDVNGAGGFKAGLFAAGKMLEKRIKELEKGN